jgi:DDE superfamily endonuclease
LLPDLGFLACTLPQGEICMPTKKSRGQELTREQAWANQALHYRRRRIEHVHSSVKRCRIVKDRMRLWKQGVRDLVMALCCALHNFRVRFTPWRPMV